MRCHQSVILIRLGLILHFVFFHGTHPNCTVQNL